MAPLKVIIVGAGIGGPAAALGLVRNGHDVTIYERYGAKHKAVMIHALHMFVKAKAALKMQLNPLPDP